MRLKLSALDHNAIEAALGSADPSLVGEYMTHRLRLLGCDPTGLAPRRLPAGKGWVRFEWSVACSLTASRRLRSDLLFDVVPSHLHFARMDGSEYLLSEGRREVMGETSPASTPGAAAYFELGVAHILGGMDHLVFLLTLLALAVRLRQVALAVTGFTVGHSVTLALAATGIAAPDAAVIEALIGLTIAWVAAENVWLAQERRGRLIPAGVVTATGVAAIAAIFTGHIGPRVLFGATLSVACYFALLGRARDPHRARWMVAALFGLIHGFAFASVLGEHELPAGELAGPLLSFNLGVEAGQLGVVAVAWPLWAGLQRVAPRTLLVRAGSTAAVGLGVFWFVSRTYG